jgi:hypothetical protein
MFQLRREEFDSLRSQIATLSSDWGGRRHPPYAFTGISSVLRSKRAVQVNIEIMRTFVWLLLNPVNDLNGAKRWTAGTIGTGFSIKSLVPI